MKKYQDIQIPDVSLRNQFVQYWMDGQYTQAFAIIDNNPQLDSKAFIADCFTLIATGILAIEGYYDTNVTQYFVQELTKYNAAINQFRKIGNWASTTAYQVGNFVNYNNDVYICIQSNTNIIPTNTAYWVFIGLRGEPGGAGIDVNLRYVWNPVASYAIRDVVTYGDYLYVAKQVNSGQVPSTTSAYWDVFLEFPKAKIIVSQFPPPQDMVYDGLIWFQILEPYTWAQVDSRGYTFQDVNNLNKTWADIDEGGW